MKKLLLTISLLFLSFLLCSCGSNITSKENPSLDTGDDKTTQRGDTPTSTIKDYYPFNENTKYVYEGNGNEYASYSIYTDYISEDRVQQRKSNGGTETVRVLENKDGELTVVLAKGECYYRENLTGKSSSNPEIILKEPLIKGTTWTLPDNSKRYISNVGVQVTTPSGDYKALEVTTEGDTGKTLDYYASNTGLVKTVFTSKGPEISSALSKIEENVPLKQTVKFYYPMASGDKLCFVNKLLSFSTNDVTRVIFEKAFKILPKGDIGKVLGPEAKIKSLYLNKDNMVYVDFSKELVSEMNAGVGFEGLILQSITNTLGTYYGAAKVYITVEGSPYSSGHIVKKKGEAFAVNLKNSVELK